jgi:PAS domain S-box-containing protein
MQQRAELEHAEYVMLESEHKYRQIFECLGDAVFLVDESSGMIIDTNERTETLLHCSRSEILGHNQTHFLRSLEKLVSRGPAPFHTWIVRPDGSTVPVLITSSRLTVYDHPLVLRLCHEHASREVWQKKLMRLRS